MPRDEAVLPRTCLVVAAGVLLFAGVGVVYVVKNPSLPPGWTWYEGPHYRVALQPGRRVIWLCDVEPVPVYLIPFGIRVSPDVLVGVCSHDLALWGKPATPDVELDRYIGSELLELRGERLVSCEAICSNGHPARVVSTMAAGRPRKRLVVVAMGWRHVAVCELAPGVFTEADADFLFRSFRPK